MSQQIPVVSKAVMALQAFIFPFDWLRAIFSPCTPDMIHYLYGPEPVFCGMLTEQFKLLDADRII
ncbi:hypothetical protein ACUWC3_28480, partial [Klebsiella pneumoniae]|uniref:hypothetical protein n=1 Tax=Klebsiella pneumoniae TaxID=573 RepID=UPI004055820C